MAKFFEKQNPSQKGVFTMNNFISFKVIELIGINHVSEKTPGPDGTTSEFHQNF